MNYKRAVTVTKFILDFMFYAGILVFITLPYTLKLAGRYYSTTIGDNYLFMLLIFAPSGLFGVLIIHRLRKMLRTVAIDNCFVYENVKSLELMAICSFCITVLFLIKIIKLPTPATIIILMVFFIAGLFSLVLSHVFHSAVQYKEENDFTI